MPPSVQNERPLAALVFEAVELGELAQRIFASGLKVVTDVAAAGRCMALDHGDFLAVNVSGGAVAGEQCEARSIRRAQL